MLSKFKKIGLIYRTVKHLKPIQVVYQVKNRLVKPKALAGYALPVEGIERLKFFELPEVKEVLKVEGDKYEFEFLNLKRIYCDKVDWNDQGHGKLWNYNLQYLDFLRQPNLSLRVRVELLFDIYKELWEKRLPLEPYPASLRIMNVIRFLSVNDKAPQQEQILAYLKAEVNYLSQNLEYHLLGNHLLENAFALVMGGTFFKESTWIKKGETLLNAELKEQILEDGAHFELSPMYHQIILFRALELIGYLPSSSSINTILQIKVGEMLNWLNKITFSNGEVPQFNDSTHGISFSSSQLLSLSLSQGIKSNSSLSLNESGFRRFEHLNLELITKVRGASPAYQPGHTHADIFSFCLNYKNAPIIVDPGTSTYNISSRREWERSTVAHNTVSVGDSNSEEVWAGFRVGRRLQTNILSDESEYLEVTHNGFKHLGIDFLNLLIKKEGNGFLIKKSLSNSTDLKKTFNLHFHPTAEIELKENIILINNKIRIEIKGDSNKISLLEYEYALGFNQLVKSKKVEISMASLMSELRISPIQ